MRTHPLTRTSGTGRTLLARPRVGLGLLALLTSLCVLPRSLRAADATPAAGDREPEVARSLSRVDRLEELYLRLTPTLAALDTSVQNLELPGPDGAPLFAAQVTSVDLAAARRQPSSVSRALVETRELPIDRRVRTGAPATLRLWRALLDQVAFFTHAKFVIVRGRFLDDAATRYQTDVHLSAAARLTSGRVGAVDAGVEVLWVQQGVASDPAGAEWRIREWRTRSVELVEAARPLFDEVLDRAMADRADLVRARASLNEQLVLRYLTDKTFQPPNKYFQPQSLNQHPGLAVVDVDRDGRDDLYVMERWGTNLLLRNRGDGTFEERAAALGLDVVDHTSSALFADFDNDGDLDVFLGRTLAPSLYLVNEDGRFVDRSAALVNVSLPSLVSSISAADYDRDGLLDVYFATYAIDRNLQQDFLPPRDAQELARRAAAPEAHLFRNRPGPPNVLLRNMGDGRFAPAPTRGELAVWRNTYQASWSDFDADGDPDVYLANDFAPNNLLRNEGRGHFADVTAETGTADLGFGMGVSWGDYDNDGAPDLYVTNMFSKAGRRITAEMGDAGKVLAGMARGNTLFRNQPGRFAHVSGLEPPALLVEKAGWGWGSQFVDVDNDGFLDVYALSGYYTAPRQAAIPKDL